LLKVVEVEDYLASKMSAASEELARIDAVAPVGFASGHRYPEASVKFLNG
jgi:hypothetical protein